MSGVVRSERDWELFCFAVCTLPLDSSHSVAVQCRVTVPPNQRFDFIPRSPKLLSLRPLVPHWSGGAGGYGGGPKSEKDDAICPGVAMEEEKGEGLLEGENPTPGMRRHVRPERESCRVRSTHSYSNVHQATFMPSRFRPTLTRRETIFECTAHV